MRAEKKVIDQLNKCYAVAEFDFDGERHLITAAEKTDPCYIYMWRCMRSSVAGGMVPSTLWLKVESVRKA